MVRRNTQLLDVFSELESAGNRSISGSFRWQKGVN